ncbi:hypothetical protein CRUP_021690 [Coryphaenoides rupestris]|nr:hypothetical protein CRUP_021690 [Coryphaenoides rupestris]
MTEDEQEALDLGRGLQRPDQQAQVVGPVVDLDDQHQLGLLREPVCVQNKLLVVRGQDGPGQVGHGGEVELQHLCGPGDVPEGVLVGVLVLVGALQDPGGEQQGPDHHRDPQQGQHVAAHQTEPHGPGPAPPGEREGPAVCGVCGVWSDSGGFGPVSRPETCGGSACCSWTTWKSTTRAVLREVLREVPREVFRLVLVGSPEEEEEEEEDFDPQPLSGLLTGCLHEDTDLSGELEPVPTCLEPRQPSGLTPPARTRLVLGDPGSDRTRRGSETRPNQEVGSEARQNQEVDLSAGPAGPETRPNQDLCVLIMNNVEPITESETGWLLRSPGHRGQEEEEEEEEEDEEEEEKQGGLSLSLEDSPGHRGQEEEEEEEEDEEEEEKQGGLSLSLEDVLRKRRRRRDRPARGPEVNTLPVMQAPPLPQRTAHRFLVRAPLCRDTSCLGEVLLK